MSGRGGRQVGGVGCFGREIVESRGPTNRGSLGWGVGARWAPGEGCRSLLGQNCKGWGSHKQTLPGVGVSRPGGRQVGGCRTCLGETLRGRGSQKQSPEAWGCRGQVKARWWALVVFEREIVGSGVARTEPRGLGVSGPGGGQQRCVGCFGREIAGSGVPRTEPRGLGVPGHGGGR